MNGGKISKRTKTNNWLFLFITKQKKRRGIKEFTNKTV